MVTTPTRRRWFQFSLATMFVVVTVFAVFVAYHVNWIHQRHELLASERDDFGLWPPQMVEMKEARPPSLLWIFGEPGYNVVEVIVNDSPEDAITESELDTLRHAQRLFPESEIYAKCRKISPEGRISGFWRGRFPWTHGPRQQEHELQPPDDLQDIDISKPSGPPPPLTPSPPPPSRH
jgi:hypothetical protein